MSDVELYIARFSPEIQRRLNEIRGIGFEVFTGVEEKVYYGLPTFMIIGSKECKLHYGAYKDHISLIVGYAMKDFLVTVYPQYNYTRATITFPHKDDFPADIVREICVLLEQWR